MKSILILIIFLSMSFISATCDSNQIDINSATVAELDKLTGIGEVYAQRIVDARPFDSVENLVKVSGIGEKTLEKIKAQGLACVENEDVTTNTNNDNDELEETKTNLTKDDSSTQNENTDDEIISTTEKKQETIQIQKPEAPKTISLNSNSITVESQNQETIYESKNEKIKKNIIYPFCGFLVFIIGALLWKR